MQDYERAKMKASREYAEGLINPEEVANPEFSDSIDFYAMCYMDGAEWRRNNRKASDEDVEEAAKEYGRQNVIDPNYNQVVVEEIASYSKKESIGMRILHLLTTKVIGFG